MTVVGEEEAGLGRSPAPGTGTGTGAPVPGPGGFPYALEEAPPDRNPAAGPATLLLPPGPPPLVPRTAAGLRLLGEYQGSGFTTPKYLARRADGQVVQLSHLLHLVASAIDGKRDTDAVARVVSAGFGREVSGDNIAYLVEHKLEPLGVTVPPGQESDEVQGPRSDLLLSLKGHRIIFGERRTVAIARSLAWLHRPLVVAGVLLLAAAMDVWLFAFHGAMTPVLNVLDQPLLLLAVFGLTVASLLFHEFGHASACHYDGARPGCIGCGIFLIWPSMYTDVTDVYRIGRAGRLRTDLGGVYFNVVFMLLLTGLYFVTGQPFLLCAVYLGHFEVLEQLMPAVRLDGYFILGDLAGVPDLYGRIRPILLSMLPWRGTDPAVADLKPRTRAVVTAWVVTMVPFLAAELAYALWNLPRLVATGARSLTVQLAGTYEAFADGEIPAGLAGVLGSLMLIVPLAGMTYLSVRLSGRLGRNALRATSGRPRLRAVLVLGVAAVVTTLAYAWTSGVTPKPLPPAPPLAPVLQPHVPVVPVPPGPDRADGPVAGPGPVGARPPGGWAPDGATPAVRPLPWRIPPAVPPAVQPPAPGPAPAATAPPAPVSPGRPGPAPSAPAPQPAPATAPATAPAAPAPPTAPPPPKPVPSAPATTPPPAPATPAPTPPPAASAPPPATAPAPAPAPAPPTATATP
ncbi:hypothetical protein GCM10010218_26810 [Streptomyces mashuensis]|uniref:Peptide zinc metalloprotease protein n=1 Tax=Streptomyces mashuensis TaxID=33904 RepID=A0A919B2J9_9ACTN|nr:hypothetical protein [Streptomyces mashuensis]GHF44131.1 hypothetical protein GCM10010218_26810 [Streptomyces mashuensis]